MSRFLVRLIVALAAEALCERIYPMNIRLANAAHAITVALRKLRASNNRISLAERNLERARNE